MTTSNESVPATPSTAYTMCTATMELSTLCGSDTAGVANVRSPITVTASRGWSISRLMTPDSQSGSAGSGCLCCCCCSSSSGPPAAAAAGDDMLLLLLTVLSRAPPICVVHAVHVRCARRPATVCYGVQHNYTTALVVGRASRRRRLRACVCVCAYKSTTRIPLSFPRTVVSAAAADRAPPRTRQRGNVYRSQSLPAATAVSYPLPPLLRNLLSVLPSLALCRSHSPGCHASCAPECCCYSVVYVIRATHQYRRGAWCSVM